ncbi:unnamed protein product [Dracunculus medinensis]|uniref:Reverse transcriptase domain-containing protein n=1 Tax=Dracunculus medinensis TaxID=318479 RepID=A0A0N4ULH7_DRAME|nr:unnamed protein product [Dracunculus medinensis]
MVLRVETATRLGDNRELFRLLRIATITREWVSEMIWDINGKNKDNETLREDGLQAELFRCCPLSGLVWKKEQILDGWSKAVILSILKKDLDAIVLKYRNIFTLKRVEHCFKYQQRFSFIDFASVFDSIDEAAIWKVMEFYGIPEKRKSFGP